MPPLIETGDYETLNELRVANSRAFDEFMLYVSKATTLDKDRYRMQLADVELTGGRFADHARKMLRPS